MFALHKTSKPRTLDRYGERVRTSTSKENMRAAFKKIFLILTSAAAAGGIIFLILTFARGNGASYFLMYMAVFIISVLFLMELFGIRVNHYKFRYGIYMTFGAGFSKLYSTSVFEVLTISLLSLLPSLGFASLICLIIYYPLGVSFTVRFSAVVGAILFNIIIVIISTYLPMKRMSMRYPSELLSADDNSNLTSSPRWSSNIFKKSFPFTYELRGMWRFRKYFFRLIVTAVSFSVVFLCGLYIAHVSEKNASLDAPEFEADATGYFSVADGDFEYIAEALKENEAFDYVFWKDSIQASGLRVHALVKDANVTRKKYVYDIKGNEKKRSEIISAGFENTVDNFELTAYSKTLLDTVSNNGIYSIEGDIYSVLNDSNTVIISEYIANLAHFDFEIGDSIILAVPDEFSAKFNETLVKAGKRGKALEDLISRSEFIYKEYKIGAIIDYGGADGNFIVGMSQTEYSRILTSIDKKTTPSFMRNLLVYTKDSSSQDDINALKDLIREELAPYSYEISQSNSAVLKTVEDQSAHTKVILWGSLLVMLISPIVWFFSQLRFYTRRSKEMYILSALGATGKRIMGIYLVSGIFLSLISAVITVSLSYAADYIIYLICTRLVPTVSAAGGVTVRFYMPPEALAVCIVSSVICGFLSSYLPFLLKRFMRSKSDIYTSDGR